MKVSQICERIIEYGFYLLFFLVPLIISPWNYELFEFNKMMLVYLFTTVIVAAWLIKMVVQRKILFRRTVMDIPLILFLGSQIMATIYSIDRHTSLWGYYSRFNGGLFSTISYLLLYWAYVSNIDIEKTKRTLRYTLSATLLVALYGIAEHFGIDAQYWVQDVQNRVFSTLGQPNWLAAWLMALMPLTWILILPGKEKLFKKKLLSFIGYGLLTIFFLCLLYTKSRSGLIGFGLAYALFWGLIGLIKLKQFKKLAKRFVIFNLILIVLTAVVGTPWTPQAGQFIKKFQPQAPKKEATVSVDTQPTPLISESSDIRKIVWQGAIKVWKHNPIFGTGVETFAYSYYWHRPRVHNDVSEWDLLYNKAHNEYLTTLANTGLVGLLTYLGLITAFIAWALKQIITEKTAFIIALLAGYISILITNFFGFSVVPVNLLFFLIPAMSLVLASKTQAKEKQMPKSDRNQALGSWQKMAITLILLLTAYSLVYLAKFWYADTRFAVAEKLNESAWYERSYNELQTAISLHPGEPYYHSEMSLALAGLANLADESDDASLSAQFAEMAISESSQALKISPYHLNFWKKRAKMFISLASIDDKYQQNALDTLLQAAELAPTDAKVHYNLGLLYSYLDQREAAIKTMEHTVELKPNYTNARYALALFYEKKGEIKEAREQLEYILENINPADTQAKDKLEKL